MIGYGISADVQVVSAPSSQGLPPAVQTIVYRVVQEALTNVLKHAYAQATVGIVFERRLAEIRIVVEDDGIGFDVHAIGSAGRRPLGSVGNAGAAKHGWEACSRIESSPGAGTTLFINIDLTSLEGELGDGS